MRQLQRGRGRERAPDLHLRHHAGLTLEEATIANQAGTPEEATGTNQAGASDAAESVAIVAEAEAIRIAHSSAEVCRAAMPCHIQSVSAATTCINKTICLLLIDGHLNWLRHGPIGPMQ